MYVYLIQPREFINGGDSSVYKIGMSSKCDLSRLRSYGVGTRYICMVEVDNYLETERRLKRAFGKEFSLDHGNEYYKVDNEEKAVSIFLGIASEMRTQKVDGNQFSDRLKQFALGVAPIVTAEGVDLLCRRVCKRNTARTFASHLAKFKFAGNNI